MPPIREIVVVQEPRHSLWQETADEIVRIISSAAAEMQDEIVVRLSLDPASDVPACFIGHAASRAWNDVIAQSGGQHCWILTSGGVLAHDKTRADDDSIVELSHVYSRSVHFRDWFLAWFRTGLERSTFPGAAGQLVQPTSRTLLSICRRLRTTASSLHSITRSAIAALQSNRAAEAEILEWTTEGLQLALADSEPDELSLNYPFVRFGLRPGPRLRELRRVFHPRTGHVVSATTRVCGDVDALQTLNDDLALALSSLNAIVSGDPAVQDDLRDLEGQLGILGFALRRFAGCLATSSMPAAARFAAAIDSDWSATVVANGVASAYPPADTSRWLVRTLSPPATAPSVGSLMTAVTRARRRLPIAGRLRAAARREASRAAADVQLLIRLQSFDVERGTSVHEGNNWLMGISPFVEVLARLRTMPNPQREESALNHLRTIASRWESTPPRVMALLRELGSAYGFRMTAAFRKESRAVLSLLDRMPRRLKQLQSGGPAKMLPSMHRDIRRIAQLLDVLRSTLTFGSSVTDIDASLIEDQGHE